jgi:hypothetical protein
VATALFANSPFKEGRATGFKSWRSHVWTDTDPDRCGTLPFVFDPGFGFERYVDYVLDVPMYFVYRGGTYHNVAGQSFRDFMEGRLPGLPGGPHRAAPGWLLPILAADLGPAICVGPTGCCLDFSPPSPRVALPLRTAPSLSGRSLRLRPLQASCPA